MLPERETQETEARATGEMRPSEGPAIPVCKSEALLQGGKLFIEHRGQLYCLRLTKAGRLLLTK